jgi:GntR family transcriptional regulator of arabinose operon
MNSGQGNKKYEIIYEKVKRDIIAKKIIAGNLLPTEQEIAAIFKTSRPTVSKAFDLLRKENLIESKAGYGTVVLKSHLTDGKKIGLLIPQFGNAEIFEPICSSIQKEALKHFWEVQLPTPLLDHEDRAVTTQNQCDKFVRENYDGVFYSPPNRIPDNENFNLNILNKLKDAGIAVVLLDREMVRWPSQTNCDLVGVDNILAGFKVAEHLIKQGCEKLVFAKNINSTAMIDLRILGSREAVRQANLPPETLSISISNNEHNLKDITKHMPDGIICANDELAANIMKKLLDIGLKIPKDLKVAGFDDVKYAEFLSVPLTTYRQPCKEIGKTAVNTMLNRLDYPDHAPIHVGLQGELIVRFSTSK